MRHLEERLRHCSPGPWSKAIAFALAQLRDHVGLSLSVTQSLLRPLYRQIGAAEIANEWHSPTASLSFPIESLSPLSVVSGYNDYQRGYLVAARQLEEHLASHYQGSPRNWRRALLFTSGMGAIQTALQFLLTSRNRLVLGRRIYYETQDLLSFFGPELRNVTRWVDESFVDAESLSGLLRTADGIFFDTISLDIDAVRIDLEVILKAYRRSDCRRLLVVLDNTVRGPAFSVPALPPGVTLFVVESLLKNYQGGLDLAASGMLTVFSSSADSELTHRLETLRGTNGTNISAFNMRQIPPLPRRVLARRLARQERNASILGGFIDVGYRCTHLPGSGLLFVEHDHAEIAARYLELLAFDRRLDVARGTSFGFNGTRFNIPPGKENQLRIACGMESEVDAEVIAATLKLALDAARNPATRALSEHPSTFFSSFPANLRPTSRGLSKLRRHLDRLRPFFRTLTD
jgi:cystathionine beta-lyase/cystathionine gamma-synthase